MKLTLQDRLAIYRKAKEDYEMKGPDTDKGFCWYFFSQTPVIAIYINERFNKILPELFQQMPEHTPYRMWFVDPGPIPERIACLDAAIKMCEQQLAESSATEQKIQIT